MLDTPVPFAVHLAHFSDVHITNSPLGWKTRDFFSKRLTGWFNYRFLGRRHRFRHAEIILPLLITDLSKRKLDRLIFSGDATALGFEVEFAKAATLLQVENKKGVPGIAVPGNHDYYTRDVQAAALFERYFAPWLVGERVDNATYPFAQRVGPFWLVAVNSSTGNLWAWDASGGVDQPQLQRLERLLDCLEPGPRIIVTHYPVCLPGGKPERRTHGLRNLSDLVTVAARGGTCLWLHGHRHGPYHVENPDLAPFPVVCAGSATQNGLWSYSYYTIQGRHFHATRNMFSLQNQRYEEVHRFEFDLRF